MGTIVLDDASGLSLQGLTNSNTVVTLRSDGSISTGGIAFGPDISLVHDVGQYYLLRVAGHSEWSGRNETEYVPLHYLIAKKGAKFAHGIWCEFVYECFPCKAWRKAPILLKEYVDNLQKKLAEEAGL